MSNIDKLLEKLSDEYTENEDTINEGVLMDYFRGKLRDIWEMALAKIGVDRANIAKGLTAIVDKLLKIKNDDNTVKDILNVGNTDGAVGVIREYGLKKVLSGAHAA